MCRSVFCLLVRMYTLCAYRCLSTAKEGTNECLGWTIVSSPVGAETPKQVLSKSGKCSYPGSHLSSSWSVARICAFLAVRKWTSHKITCLKHSEEYSSVTLRTRTMVRSHRHYLILRYLHHPTRRLSGQSSCLGSQSLGLCLS